MNAWHYMMQMILVMMPTHSRSRPTHLPATCTLLHPVPVFLTANAGLTWTPASWRFLGLRSFQVWLQKNALLLDLLMWFPIIKVNKWLFQFILEEINWPPPRSIYCERVYQKWTNTENHRDNSTPSTTQSSKKGSESMRSWIGMCFLHSVARP